MGLPQVKGNRVLKSVDEGDLPNDKTPPCVLKLESLTGSYRVMTWLGPFW